ncbi:MAG: hypothetical protein AAF390_16480, partial [Pseudomonadota bacterium]
MFRSLFAAATAFALCVGSASAATIFFDDFSDEPTGRKASLSATGFQQFTVQDGTVDVIRTGAFGIGCQTVKCIDLDGSSRDAGLLLSDPIAFRPGAAYTLAFTISGNQRSGADDTVAFGVSNDVFSDTLTLTAGDGYADLSFGFTVASNVTGSIFFANSGGDNVGAVLDRVSLDEVSLAAVP